MRVSPIAEGVGDTANAGFEQGFILSSSAERVPGELAAPCVPILCIWARCGPAMNSSHRFFAVFFQLCGRFLFRRRFYVYAKLLIGLY